VFGWLVRLWCRAFPLPSDLPTAEPPMKACVACSHWCGIYDLKNGGTSKHDDRLHVRNSTPYEGFCLSRENLGKPDFAEVNGSYRYDDSGNLLTMPNAKCNRWHPASAEAEESAEAAD